MSSGAIHWLPHDCDELVVSLTTRLFINRISLHYQSSLDCTVGWVVLHVHDSTVLWREMTYSRTDVPYMVHDWDGMLVNHGSS